MFRETDPQRHVFSPGGLMGPELREQCEKSWAGPFRREAWPILLAREHEFADLFDPANGRPNRSVALLLGTLILKDMFDLTDEETHQHLYFDLRWMYAFDAEPQELRPCVKTLHNFRRRLLQHEKGQAVFEAITDSLIPKLGLDTSRQRLDSKHVMSNIAILGRLGLFCETIRVFLAELKKKHPKLYEREVSAGIRRRHADDEDRAATGGGNGDYADARKAERTRRLQVAARDVYRLVTKFRGFDAIRQDVASFGVLERLFGEQCRKLSEPREPKDDDDDRGEGGAPVTLKSPSEVRSDSLQSPHDRDATYSGHKGKGYEEQVSETCVKKNPVQLITHVEVTRSSEGDQQATIPVLQDLQQRRIKPKELVTDTNFGGGKNAAEASAMGVNLLCPAPPSSKPEEGVTYEKPPERCPTDPKAATQWLRAREAQREFDERYAIRAGIEATNSELNRAHGGKKLRVRGGERVQLSVSLKAAACNLKRALKYWCGKIREAIRELAGGGGAPGVNAAAAR